jgi:hypothetical protein
MTLNDDLVVRLGNFGLMITDSAGGEAAVSARRTQSFPGAKYRRLVKRMPKKEALVATGN